MNRAVFQVSLCVVRKMIKGELFEGEEDPVLILWKEEEKPFPYSLW